MELSFWITRDKRHPVGDIIYGRQNRLRVQVARPHDTTWCPAPEEVRIFGRAGNELLVFETIDIRPDDALDMIAAVRCYAGYIGLPDMALSASL